MKNIIKLIITIAIFYFLFKNIDFVEFSKILFNSHGGWIAVALFMQLISTYLAAYRWFKISQLLVFKERVSLSMSKATLRELFSTKYFHLVLVGMLFASST
ncbi:MAG: hypothetical protein Q9M40_11950 [Sulfurimonas sp.]|nr:hypothetical protein [Sulfurimonas sp.]